MTDRNGRPPIRRLDRPTTDDRPRYDVIRLEGGQRETGIIVLSPRFWGYPIHFDQVTKRSEPCFESPESCTGCAVGKPRKEVWYLCCANAKWGVFFLEMPPDAAKNFLAMLPEGESLRGLRITASRTRASNGRVRIEIEHWASRKQQIAPDIDPIETLQALWQWGRK